MCGLLRFFAIGVAVLFALDYVAPPGGTGLNLLRQSTGWPVDQPLNVVDRARKGDRLPMASAGRHQNTVIATVEVTGGRDPAVVYRAGDGQIIFQSDPAANATLVAKGVVIPEVTVRETRKAAPPTGDKALSPGPSAAKPAREQKILEGCDPAFSPLAASAQANFSARCLASNTPLTRFAAAEIP